MKYIDTGSRDPTQALGTWLATTVGPDVVAVRWQSGFFSFGAFQDVEIELRAAAARGATIRGVVGSNEGGTLASDVLDLIACLGIPSSGARIGVVHYRNAFFHPKTVHVVRGDGSQAAYVGSANLTTSGVVSSHVEAGLLLDTRDSDDATLIDEVRAAIDGWFSAPRSGFHEVQSHEDVERLCADGVLDVRRPKLVKVVTGSGSSPPEYTAPPLAPLLPIRGGRGAREEEAPPTVVAAGTTIATPADDWLQMWQSNPLTMRDLALGGQGGGTTHSTGSMLLKGGAWMANADADFRHYFFDEVFAALMWSVGRQAHLRETFAVFEIDVEGQTPAEHVLRIGHNTSTTMTTYTQRNGMTSLSWRDASPLVRRNENLGRVLTLYRSKQDARRFRITIVQP